ncbi:hypothetical protein CDL12_11455 [Handroanthus impetiginosus]|uniref:BHLH domain-containing protein n=1 Tax=Handroanthus impetiginosus TaxID=429701 RepID=A0A2G9HEE3_9LAMI|nr:hypothetical protein CDL12_11455 [Handroanthus impetiginosus]
MANNPGEAPSGDFFDQILGFTGYAAGAEGNLVGNEVAPAAMMLHLGSGDGSPQLGGLGGIGVGIGGGYGVGSGGSIFPLGLSLEQGREGFNDTMGRGNRFCRDDAVASRASSIRAPIGNTVPAVHHPPAVRPRVRARRGQATDPHSIAERLRRERIAERIRALQDLVPSVNKTDRAVMLDEILDYVKFLKLQVKVLSMSRMGGAEPVAPLVTDMPLSSVQEEGHVGEAAQPAWAKLSNDGTERHVAKLMEENVGAAMQLLQSKALCIMPISLASAIYHTQAPDTTTLMKPASNPPS